LAFVIEGCVKLFGRLVNFDFADILKESGLTRECEMLAIAKQLTLSNIPSATSLFACLR
jgi:hypothetical protein